MAATNESKAGGMILPTWDFLVREARTALRDFYYPFGGLYEAWQGLRGGKPRSSRLPIQAPTGDATQNPLQPTQSRNFFDAVAAASEDLYQSRTSAIAEGAKELFAARLAGRAETDQALKRAIEELNRFIRQAEEAALIEEERLPPLRRKP